MIKFDLFNNPFLENLGSTRGIQAPNKGLTGASAGALVNGVFGIGTTLANATSSIPQVASAQESSKTDMFGTPQYNLGNLQSNITAIERSDPSSGLVGSTAIQGAAAGASFGVPGVLIGGAVGALAGLVGADSAEDEKRKRLEEAHNRLASAQKNFNAQNEQANRNRLAYEQYMQMISA